MDGLTIFLLLFSVLCAAVAGYLWHRYQSEQKEVQHLRQLVNEHKREMAESKALFTVVSAVAYDAVLVLDEDSTIIGLNRSAKALFQGRNPVGEILYQALDTPDLQDIVINAIRASEDGEPFEEQLQIGEQTYRVHTHVMPYEGGRFIGVALQNITELVRLNRARRDMVANISHELRTPIARIRLIIDSLFHESEKPKRKDSISSLRAIASETESLQWLVQEMLDLSMIESGQATIRLVDVPLDELVDGALERLEDQCAAKDIKIKRDFPKNLHVLCDRDLARRVIINLVHNAIKWSPKGGKIKIKAEKQADEVIISVLDNGPGISEDQVDRIFERFYQVDASRSGHEGTGLGLAICRHIVEAHGGRIWAESNRDGGGGRFRFTLLVANSEESTPAISKEMS